MHLKDIFDNNTEGEIHKWNHYFDIYERHLERFVGTEVVIVEFGVFQGGSLKMWKKYFGDRCKVYGVDINPLVKRFESDGVEIIIGDQDDKKFLSDLANKIGKIDVLIDDGGHTMSQQINTFNAFFDKIQHNGVYICEDLHTSYQLSFGGGYLARKSFIEFSKRLIDNLNAWQSEDFRLNVSRFTKSAYSMNFYESMLVIEKKSIDRPTHLKSGSSIVDDYVYTPKSMVLKKIKRKLIGIYAKLRF